MRACDRGRTANTEKLTKTEVRKRSETFESYRMQTSLTAVVGKQRKRHDNKGIQLGKAKLEAECII